MKRQAPKVAVERPRHFTFIASDFHQTVSLPFVRISRENLLFLLAPDATILASSEVFTSP